MIGESEYSLDLQTCDKSVELCAFEVVDAMPRDNHFKVTLEDGTHITARKLLLATGVVDELPEIDGKGSKASELALELTMWSRDLVLCTDGPAELEEKQLRRLKHSRIQLCEVPIARLEGKDGIRGRPGRIRDQY